jgi:LacI family transcriptional regulator
VPRPRPTIHDVAREAGASIATVSRALNGGVVSAAALARIEAAVARLGYRRNDVARGLATGRSGLLGVVVPDVAGPLYALMARGIEDVTEPLGMQFFMLTDNRSAEFEAAAIAVLLERRVDGLILIGSLLEAAALEGLLADGPEVVLVEREGDATMFPTIGIDDEGGARSATEHLVACGHGRIAHVTGIRRAGERRLAGYLAAMASAGLEAGPLIAADFSEGSGAAAAASLLDHPDVTAVFCSNDRIALGLGSALFERGVSVGRDLSVVGFDDLPFSAYLTPPLTTVRQDARAIGRLAARQVVGALAGTAGAPFTVSPTELIVRASVAPGPAAVHEREVHGPRARQPTIHVSRRNA